MTETRDSRDIVDRLRHAPVVFGTEMFGATRLLEDAAAEIERLRSQRVAVPDDWAKRLSCDEQLRLATRIAANIGYRLVEEEPHPDCPHHRAEPKRAQNGWQDISTAPKDQTVHGVVDGEVRLIRWCNASHVPFHGWCVVDQGAEDRDLCMPTHWMPLPAPPAAAIRARAHGGDDDQA